MATTELRAVDDATYVGVQRFLFRAVNDCGDDAFGFELFDGIPADVGARMRREFNLLCHKI